MTDVTPHGGRLHVGPDPPPCPLYPPTHTNLWQQGTANLGATGTQKLFWPFVKGSENWFHPRCLYPKCFSSNGEFKSFFSPTALAWGYVAILISPHQGDPEKAYVVIYVCVQMDGRRRGCMQTMG